MSRNKSPSLTPGGFASPASSSSSPFSMGKQKIKYENSQAICAINDAYLNSLEKTMKTAQQDILHIPTLTKGVSVNEGINILWKSRGPLSNIKLPIIREIILKFRKTP